MSTVNKQCLLHRRRFAVATCYSAKTLEMAMQVIRMLERENNPSDDFEYLSPSTKYGGPQGTNNHRTQEGRIATLSLWLGPDLSTWAQGPHNPRIVAAFQRYGISDRMEDEMYQVGMRPSVAANPTGGGAPAAPDVSPQQQMLRELTPPPAQPAKPALSDYVGHSQQMIQDALKNRMRESANAKANEEQKARESKKALDNLAKFEASLKRIAADEDAKRAKAAEAAEKKKAEEEAAAAKKLAALKAIADAKAAQDKEAKRAAEKKAREEKQAADAAAEKARQAAAEEEKARMLAENAEQERLAAERKQLEAKQAAEKKQREEEEAKKARELAEQKQAEAAAALAAEQERLKKIKEDERKAAEEERQRALEAEKERRAAKKKAREEKEALEKKQAEEQKQREEEERRKREEEARRIRDQKEAEAKIIKEAEEAKRLADAAERKRVADAAAELRRQQEAELQRQRDDELKGRPSQEPENPPPQQLARNQTIGASIFGNVMGFFGLGGGGEGVPQAAPPMSPPPPPMAPPPQNAAAPPLRIFKDYHGQVVGGTRDGVIVFGVLKEPVYGLKLGDELGSAAKGTLWKSIGNGPDGFITSRNKAIFHLYAKKVDDELKIGPQTRAEFEQIFRRFAPEPSVPPRAATPKRAGTFTAAAQPEPVEAEEESPSASREPTPKRMSPPPPPMAPPPQPGRPGRAGTLVSHAPRPQGSRVVRSNTMTTAPLFKDCKGQVVVAQTTSGNVTFGVLKEPNGALNKGDPIGAKQWMYVGASSTVISKERATFIAYAYSFEDLKRYGITHAGERVTSDLKQIFQHFARL